MTNNSRSYVSCMKINGVPILPPVITPRLRTELQCYKQQAIRIEKHLAAMRAFKANLLLITANSSLEQTLAFDQPKTTVAENNVPYSRLTSLTCDIQASQYTNNEFQVIDTEKMDTKQHAEPDAGFISDNDLDTTADDQPRIRKNSYTLDKPGPSLAQFLLDNNITADYSTDNRQNAMRDVSYKKESDITADNSKANKQNEIDVSYKNKSDITADYSQTNRPNVMGDVLFKSESVCVSNEVELTNISTKNESNASKAHDVTNISSAIESPLVDIAFENESSQITKPAVESSPEEVSLLKRSSMSDTDTELMNMSLHDSIDTRIDRDQLADEMRSLNINNEQNDNYTPYYNESNQELFKILKDIPKDYSEKLLDVLREHSTSELPTKDLPVANLASSGDLEDIKRLRAKHLVYAEDTRGPWTSSRDLEDARRSWAASVLTAATRGFLVRRLLRSERVQQLIETIRAALVCALQLHREDAKHIQQSDVELHRRLIQQVSAACSDFHDVFFKLTTRDQMHIIAVDRLKKLDRLKRPRPLVSSGSNKLSASTSSRDSGQSNTRRKLFPKAIPT